MLQNGITTLLRISGCILVAVAGLLGGVYLISTGHQVPTEYWALTMASVIGVAGAEVARSIGQSHQSNGGLK